MMGPDLVPAQPVEPERMGNLVFDTDPHIFGFLHRHDREVAERHLAAQWQAEGGSMSFSHATAAVIDGRTAGIEIGYGKAERAAASAPFGQCLATTLSPTELEPWIEWSTIGTFVIPAIPDDAYYLQHLAVDPDHRGEGIGRQLLDNAFAVANAGGYSRVHLDVYDGNPAQRLYERAGMQVVVETLVPSLVERGIGLHRRLEFKL